MNKLLILMMALVITMFMAVSCDAAEKNETETTVVTESEELPSGMPARPGSDVTGDPSGNLPVEITGIVKDINDSLVLIELPGNGGEFMLRFSENTKWDTGVNTEIVVGNKIVSIVKLEPTVTTPSQGEVMQIISNDAAV